MLNGFNFGMAIATATGKSTKLSKKILPSSSVVAILICVLGLVEIQVYAMKNCRAYLTALRDALTLQEKEKIHQKRYIAQLPCQPSSVW